MDSLSTRYGRLDTKPLLILAFYDSHGVFILFLRTGILGPNPLCLLQHPTLKSEAMVTRPFFFHSIKIVQTGPRWLGLLAVYDPYMVVIHFTDHKTHQQLSKRCTAVVMTVLQLQLLRLTTSSTDHDELHIRSPFFQLHHPNQHLYLTQHHLAESSHLRFSRPSREQKLPKAASMQGSSHFRFLRAIRLQLLTPGKHFPESVFSTISKPHQLELDRRLDFNERAHHLYPPSKHETEHRRSQVMHIKNP